MNTEKKTRPTRPWHTKIRAGNKLGAGISKTIMLFLTIDSQTAGAKGLFVRRYSRIRALVLSLFSPDLYRDVVANWRGVGFLYLLLILALTWIPEMYKAQVGFKDFAQTEFPNMIRDFPPITITKGVV